MVIYGRFALLARHVIAMHDTISLGAPGIMTVLMQMWVGRQRPRRQEFQMLSVPIGQKLAYVYYECEPGRRSAARSHRARRNSSALLRQTRAAGSGGGIIVMETHTFAKDS